MSNIFWTCTQCGVKLINYSSLKHDCPGPPTPKESQTQPEPKKELEES